MTDAMTAAYDKAYDAITGDQELALARKKLSLHELRLLVGHCAVAFAGAAWRPMDTLPDDGGPAATAKILVLAMTADGRVMQMPPWMLRDVAKRRTPQHLQFPAIGWMHVPTPPSSASSSSRPDEPGEATPSPKAPEPAERS